MHHVKQGTSTHAANDRHQAIRKTTLEPAVTSINQVINTSFIQGPGNANKPAKFKVGTQVTNNVIDIPWLKAEDRVEPQLSGEGKTTRRKRKRGDGRRKHNNRRRGRRAGSQQGDPNIERTMLHGIVNDRIISFHESRLNLQKNRSIAQIQPQDRPGPHRIGNNSKDYHCSENTQRLCEIGMNLFRLFQMAQDSAPSRRNPLRISTT